jgi:hypothetical protein
MGIKIIPSDLSSLTSGEKRVANKIKNLYNSIDRVCYLYAQPRLKHLEPDFILIDPLKGICIIEVKDWSINYIETIDRTDVYTTGGKRDNPVFWTNKYFNLAKGLFERDPRLLDEDGHLNFNLYSKVIFTNITSSECETNKLGTVLNQPPTIYLTSNKLERLAINSLFSFETSYLDPAQMEVIRAILFPEITIHNDLGNESDSVDINETIKALDSEQEQFAKRIPYGHYMVSGVPGSGKTVILLSRAIFLSKENHDWKIRIVTYNRSLVRTLKSRLESLHRALAIMGIKYENISISTFHSLALEVANTEVPQDPDADWWPHELPQKALENARPRFDAFLIDEYQDFYDDWIKLCLALCKKRRYNDREESENFFLAGDRLQSIYNPHDHPWISLGVKLRGRSKLLKHTYRSGRDHIELALDFLMADSKLKKEVENFYEGREGIDNITELNSQINFLEGGYEVINNLLEQLMFSDGYNPEDILILIRPHSEAEELYRTLTDELKRKCKVTKEEVLENKCTITTYKSSKGLESKICILVNVSSFPYRFLTEIEERKLLYVGMTRASQRLYIHATNYEDTSFAKELRQLRREF